jgi:5'-phosphate synthase pdxT subunit
MKVGILAVQGDFEAHAATLARLGADYVFVRVPRDLEGVDAVIFPGGESTTQWKFLVRGRPRQKFARTPRAAARSSAPAPERFCSRAKFTTPRSNRSPSPILPSFATATGASSRAKCATKQRPSRPNPSKWFSFAPHHRTRGPGVEVLADSEGQPVLIRQGHLLIATFHPELTSDTTVHEYFLRMIRDRGNGHLRGSGTASNLSATPVEPR